MKLRWRDENGDLLAVYPQMGLQIVDSQARAVAIPTSRDTVGIRTRVTKEPVLVNGWGDEARLVAGALRLAVGVLQTPAAKGLREKFS